jgi:hypothetical protein
MLGDECFCLKSHFSPVTIHIGFVMKIVAVWCVLVFILIISSKLLNTQAQLDIHESWNQPTE